MRPTIKTKPLRSLRKVMIRSLFYLIATTCWYTTSFAGPVPNITAYDQQFSIHASRLTDSVIGSIESDSWYNSTNAWQDAFYPMSAVLDLGADYTLSSIAYYAGQIPFPATAKLRFEYASQSNPDAFQSLATAFTPKYDAWSAKIGLSQQRARYIRVVFDSRLSRFNLSELDIQGEKIVGDGQLSTADLKVTIDNGMSTYTPGSATNYTIIVTNNGPDTATNASLNVVLPSGINNALWTCTTLVGAVCTAATGIGTISTTIAAMPSFSSLTFALSANIDQARNGPLSVTAKVTAPATIIDSLPDNNSASDTDNDDGVPISNSDQPQPTVPGASIVRAHGFGNWPSDHLTTRCKTLHDRYWVQGPNAGQSANPNHPGNLAYPTWHPAITTHPDTGEICDFGHEHGYNPEHAPTEVFSLAGGWPPFGYAATVAGGSRHEDHVGHKVSVAHFRASIGNGGGSQTLYDAGFECDWMSKIHQGSSSMDAFSNHLHEYFLTLRCMDGINTNGIMDGRTLGTAFSIKVMYTYGEPNKFVESKCSGGATYASTILNSPEGGRAPGAMQLLPLGLDKPNHRGFSCASGVIWKNMESEIREVDLWTELIKIQRNDGATAITIQPYYIVKNPARIIQSFNKWQGEQPSQVVRTIDLCYDNNGQRKSYGYCVDAPDPRPADWIGWQDPRSPFNGTLRAINFKASHLSNAAGVDTFCTTASGQQVQDEPPCAANHILQTARKFNNNWNNGRYTYNGRRGNIQGAIWSQDPKGNRFETTPDGHGGYEPLGIGFEFVIDNRQPDDNLDGIPDGATIRGVN